MWLRGHGLVVWLPAELNVTVHIQQAAQRPREQWARSQGDPLYIVSV